ncbi:MAG: aldehyde ferredoxin oxidoreductase C-terminal domain-containing protein, partial [Desulfobacterales bacterium]
QIGSREGFGAILSQGVRNAAKVIGRGSERFAAHVKGLEMSGYHPYSIMGTALGYAVATRGADFNDIYATLEYKWLPEKADREFGTPEAVNLQSIRGKALLIRQAMVVGVVLDSLGLCKVPALCLICKFDLESEAELVSTLIGQPINGSELFRIGERIINLERLFNLRQGAASKDDRLPDMFFKKEYNSARKSSNPQEWMEPMKQDFYHLMGWNEEGIPTGGKLEELGLSPAAYPVESAA